MEDTFTYIEAALRSVPCHRILLRIMSTCSQNLRHAEPLSDFLEFDTTKKDRLINALKAKDKGKVTLPRRTQHKLTQYQECAGGLKNDVPGCYNTILKKVDGFLATRSFMWPTFAGNGFEVE